MKNGIKSTALWRILARIYRLLVPSKPESLEFSGEKWDQEYQNSQWDYLENISELGRYSVITGYVGYLKPDAALLEIGCGTGLLFNRLKHLPYEYYKGVDISEKAIERASVNNNQKTSFVTGDGACFADDKVYDIIIFNEALYYFDDCMKVLDHYFQYLKPNGFVVISMVVGDTSRLHWQEISKHCNVLDSVQLTNRAGITWNCRVIQPRPERQPVVPAGIASSVFLPLMSQALTTLNLDMSLPNFFALVAG